MKRDIRSQREEIIKHANNLYPIFSMKNTMEHENPTLPDDISVLLYIQRQMRRMKEIYLNHLQL